MKKLTWGLIGGGEGSQIGPVHRLVTRICGDYDFVAAALDRNPTSGRAYAQKLGIEPRRAYGDWREMLAAEVARSNRLDLITVATPNATHFEISRAFLQNGFHVFCEKPMTMTVAESKEIVKIVAENNRICAVNYGYSGYALVRQMRAMVKRGDLGKIRLVFTQFSHGHHADAADMDNPRIRWRYDSTQVGVSAQFADCGIHALHLANFITDQRVESVSADLVSCVQGRMLEDDASINFRLSGGCVGRLWTSAIALGRQHGLDIQVFGEKGGLRWSQEHPNQLYWMPLNQRLQIIERGEAGLAKEAQMASRIAIGHTQGMLSAFATLYKDIAALIYAQKSGKTLTTLCPLAIDGLHSIASLHAVVESGRANGTWISVTC